MENWIRLLKGGTIETLSGGLANTSQIKYLKHYFLTNLP